MADDDFYGWWDALERFDFAFDDFADVGQLMDALAGVLGRPATQMQIESAQFFLGQQRQQAILQGFTQDRFLRAGRTVVQLRDRFGRFVTSGVTEIRQRLERGG